MTGPLAGLHVVELANEISGSYAAKLFVDLGAEVTKIEPPAGDPLRRWGPFPGDQGVADPERSGLFHYLNAGKRGATIDLGQPEGLAAARELIAQAHVLVEDFAPGTLEGWALGPDALSRLNPNLLLLRISAFGQCGPWRHRRATSLTVQAASGWISARDPDRPPVAGRRPHRRVRRGCLRRAGRADRAAAAARRPGPGGRRLPVGGAAVDAALPDVDGAADAIPGSAPQPAVGAHAGYRPGRRRVGGNQLPDGSALAGRVRDARPARVRRAADRDHAGRPGARRVLRQGAASARPAERRRDRGARVRRCASRPPRSTTGTPSLAVRSTPSAVSSSQPAGPDGRFCAPDPRSASRKLPWHNPGRHHALGHAPSRGPPMRVRFPRPTGRCPSAGCGSST